MVIGNADFKDQFVLLLTVFPFCRQSAAKHPPSPIRRMDRLGATCGNPG